MENFKIQTVTRDSDLLSTSFIMKKLTYLMSPADYKTWVLTFGGWLLCNDGFSETPPCKNKSFPLAGTVGMQTYASVVGHCLELFIN